MSLRVETEDRGERPRPNWKRWRAGIVRDDASNCLYTADDHTEQGAILKALGEYRLIHAQDGRDLDRLLEPHLKAGKEPT